MFTSLIHLASVFVIQRAFIRSFVHFEKSSEAQTLTSFINSSRISPRVNVWHRSTLGVNFNPILWCSPSIIGLSGLSTTEGLSVLSWKYFVCIANLFVVVMCLDLLFAKERKSVFAAFKAAGNWRKVSLKDRTEQKASRERKRIRAGQVTSSLSLSSSFSQKRKRKNIAPLILCLCCVKVLTV